jgi:hypothetical protein
MLGSFNTLALDYGQAQVKEQDTNDRNDSAGIK